MEVAICTTDEESQKRTRSLRKRKGLWTPNLENQRQRRKFGQIENPTAKEINGTEIEAMDDMQGIIASPLHGRLDFDGTHLNLPMSDSTGATVYSVPMYSVRTPVSDVVGIPPKATIKDERKCNKEISMNFNKINLDCIVFQ